MSSSSEQGLLLCSSEGISLPGSQGLSFCSGNMETAQQRPNPGIFFSEMNKETLHGRATSQMTSSLLPFKSKMDLSQKLVVNSSVFSPSELSSIRLPTGLATLQQALLRLPLAHGVAQATLPQQGSLPPLNAPCFFFILLPLGIGSELELPNLCAPFVSL